MFLDLEIALTDLLFEGEEKQVGAMLPSLEQQVLALDTEVFFSKKKEKEESNSYMIFVYYCVLLCIIVLSVLYRQQQ